MTKPAPQGFEPHGSEWWNAFWSDRDRNFGPPRETLVQLVVDHTTNIGGTPSETQLIDIGSGNGRYAIPFAELGYRTTVLERSDVACSLIGDRARASGVTDNLDIVKADILQAVGSSGVNPGTFDVVFSSGLLEEVPKDDQEIALRNITSLAKRGGLLVLKYCLEIDGRGVTVEDGSVASFFQDNSSWEVHALDTDPSLRESIATISFENSIRTETLIASRI